MFAVLAACGGGDAESATESEDESPAQEQPSADGADFEDTPDVDDAADSGEDERDGEDPGTSVCDLLSFDEVSAAVGYDVTGVADNSLTTSVCEYELDVPAEEGLAGMFPILQVGVMSEEAYRQIVEPMGDLLTPVEGVGDEAGMAFVPGTAGAPSQVQYFAFSGDTGVRLMPAVNQFADRTEAEAAMSELASLIFDRL